ncbi:hypothetical protein [Actinomadura rupiterrae]|uniref:hypothetical protein n=1 Tax=Actinomadura rupiterrae TaxID=559627 RepID=UPI0020A4E453|nr:hypothetical protein [Actinomadura rupiterrae]MCP2341141.1 galactarate dehydratase [Actinomadura rupiterrae]
MSNRLSGGYVPAEVAGASLAPEDMARVGADDWADIGRLARGYCRTVDASRRRKCMDGSATVTHGGHPSLGTDDVSDDVTQDAVLIFAERLRDVVKSCAVTSQWIDTREAASWRYVRKDGTETIITRTTMQRWAVRDAAKRNGYRLDIPPSELEATPNAQLMHGKRHAQDVTRAALVASPASAFTAQMFGLAYGDGRDFPTLGRLLYLAGMATDLGRAGLLATAAQAVYGGSYGSRRQVNRLRDKAIAEWHDLSQRLDEIRNDMLHGDGQSGP